MLTSLQIACIIILLQAFGVDPSIVDSVQADLAPKVTQVAPIQNIAPSSVGASQDQEISSGSNLVVQPSIVNLSFTTNPHTVSKTVNDEVIAWTSSVSSQSWFYLCTGNPMQSGQLSLGSCVIQTYNRNSNISMPDGSNSVQSSDNLNFNWDSNNTSLIYVVEMIANGQRVDYVSQL